MLRRRFLYGPPSVPSCVLAGNQQVASGFHMELAKCFHAIHVEFSGGSCRSPAGGPWVPAEWHESSITGHLCINCDTPRVHKSVPLCPPRCSLTMLPDSNRGSASSARKVHHGFGWGWPTVPFGSHRVSLGLSSESPGDHQHFSTHSPAVPIGFPMTIRRVSSGGSLGSPSCKQGFMRCAQRPRMVPTEFSWVAAEFHKGSTTVHPCITHDSRWFPRGSPRLTVVPTGFYSSPMVPTGFPWGPRGFPAGSGGAALRYHTVCIQSA